MNNHGWGNNPEPGDNKGDKRKPSDNQGPPDLEDLWRDLNQRLSGLFGAKSKKPGGGGFGDKRPSFTPRQFGGGVGVILCLIFIVWAASGFYIVDASERGVVLRFGRYSETTSPGLRWRMPFPIESNEVVNLSGVRRLEIGYRGTEKNKVLQEALMLTDDENIVNIQFAVQYLLKDPQLYLFNNRNTDEAVMQAAETSIREVVGKSKMDFVLYEGRDQIATNTQKLMQEILDRYKTGVLVSSVTMQSAQPPEQVQAAFEDAVKAGQDKLRSKNEGEAYANDVIPRAKGAASRLLEEAAGYKQRVIATAEGDASRFKQIVAEYSKAPEVTRTRMYLETMQQIYSNTSKVMVDAKGQGNLLYLPLDKLLAASAAIAPPAAANDAVVPRGAVPSTSTFDSVVPPQLEKVPPVDTGSYSSSSDARRRDSSRSRERGDR
ncbi:MAG TPA: FtsH protease activity modulator HflK [Rhodocyclaceae bacterium]|nr:FtsH protease activity modulator HflK [Rhodocyclaceae bacterium]